jgi:hypothetical protein
MSLVQRVQKLMNSAVRNINSDSLIKPISDDYHFSSNGVYFFVGRMGTGKTYEVWRHIYTTELLSKKPYYSEVIYCSTSGAMDKTTEAMCAKMKGVIRFVSETELMSYLTKHLKWKLKYYALIKFTLSKFTDANDEMLRIIAKHNLENREESLEYISSKLSKYNTCDYPFRTLLVLDDFAGSPLLKKVDSPLARILTKTRHYHLTCIIIAQTFRFISLNVRRLATDVIIFSKFSEDDFIKALHQFPNNLNYKDAWEKYKQLTNPHARLVLNMVTDESHFINS